MSLSNIGITFYFTITDKYDETMNTNKQILLLTSLVLYVLNLTLDLLMAVEFFIVGVFLLRAKIEKYKVLRKEMPLKLKLVIVFVVLIFLLNLNSIICRFFYTSFSSDLLYDPTYEHLRLTSIVMMHIVIQITDCMTALTILYLINMMAMSQLQGRLANMRTDTEVSNFDEIMTSNREHAYRDHVVSTQTD